MCIPRVSSVPTGLIVADFSVHASVPSAGLCLDDTVANMKGKRIKGGGQNQQWPTSAQGGKVTPAAWGVTTVSERGAQSEGAHKWARWSHNPCRLGGPHRLRAGGIIRSGYNQKWKKYIFGGPRHKAWISELGDNIKNSPEVGPVAVRSGKTFFLGK